MHTNPALNCQSCHDKFLTCDSRIVDFTRKVQSKFPDCHIAVAYRDQADQILAYQTGKSKLEYPYSKHNHTDQFGKPSSLAVDLFLLDFDRKALFPITWYSHIFEYYSDNKDLFSHPVVWGGHWTHLKDYDHFELIDG